MNKLYKTNSKPDEADFEDANYFLALFYVAPFCIYLVDLQGRVKNMNPIGLRLMGFENESEVVGFKFVTLIGSGNIQHIEECFNNALKGISSKFEYAVDLQSGMNFFESSFIPINNSEGQVVSIMGVSKNITQQKNAQKALRSNQNQLKAVFDNAPVEMYLKDKEGRYVQINRQFEKLFKVKNEEVVGLLPEEIHYSGLGRQTREHDKRILKSGKTETVQQLAETSLGPRTLHTVKFPIFDEFGAISGLGAVVSDITEFKRVEAALAESDERLQQAAELAGLGYSAWDVASGKCIYCSAKYSDIFNLSIDEFIQHSANIDNWISQIHPSDWHQFQNFRELNLQLGNAEIEYRLKTPEGDVRYIHEFRKQLFDEKENLSEILFTIRDISRFKKTESKIHQAQKMEALGHLTGGIAHDFNNILTIIMGNLELLERSTKTYGIQHSLLAEAQEATSLGADLINNLMDFSEQRVLTPEPANINDLVSETVGILRRTFGENFEIKLDLQQSEIFVTLDVTQFKNAVINLAINSRDSMIDGGVISISTRLSQKNNSHSTQGDKADSVQLATISILDSGAGMAPEVAERIFEPFFSTKKSSKGMGMGLSVVYGFVNQAGGEIIVDSEVGKGTKIEMIFPAVQMRGCSNTPPKKTSNQKVDGLGKSVLIVEDDRHVRKVASKRFKMLNFTVFEASGAQQALDIIARKPNIDVLFTDIVMPGELSGVDLARQIRRTKANIKIILTTGYTEEQRELQNEFTVLRKPYRHNELEVTINQIHLNS